jgi:hypothetical protein
MLTCGYGARDSGPSDHEIAALISARDDMMSCYVMCKWVIKTLACTVRLDLTHLSLKHRVFRFCNF